MTTEGRPRPPAKERASSRPEAGVRGAITDAVSRLLSRGPRGDGEMDPGATPMSDAELREAFRIASLMVTPAPLGRAGRPRGKEAAEPQPDRAGSPVGERAPGARDAPRIAAAAASAASTPAAPSAAPADPDGPEPGGVRWAAGSARLTGAPSPPAAESRPAALPDPGDESTVDEPGGADDGAGPGAFRPVSGPDPTDPRGLPGNLAASADDFFDGLVRRVERQA